MLNGIELKCYSLTKAREFQFYSTNNCTIASICSDDTELPSVPLASIWFALSSFYQIAAPMAVVCL